MINPTIHPLPTPLDIIKLYDYFILGIPYKKNRSARLQKKMQKIVRGRNERATIATNANAVS